MKGIANLRPATHITGLAAACWTAWALAAGPAQAAELSTDKSAYAPGEAITVNFKGGPANAKDWIGIYPKGIKPGSVGSTLWFYVNGTRTATTGVAEGKVTFTTGLNTAGEYDVHFLRDDAYEILASAAFTVSAPATQPPPQTPAGPSVTSNHANYFPGEPIVVSFRGGPGNAKDWIGIYPEGVEPGTVGSTLWFYVNGTRTATTGTAEGTITFGAGLNLAGVWVAYLLRDDGYGKLAQTTFQVVDPATPLVRPDKPVYQIDSPIQVEFRNGFGNSKDWIGIYPKGVTPGSQPATRWAYVNGTQTATTGKTDGTVSFANGLNKTGEYDVHLLLNDGYDIFASASIRVVEAAALKPRILSLQPAKDASNVSPQLEFKATLTNGTTRVVASSVQLKLDGAVAAHSLAQAGGLVTVTFTNAVLLAPKSQHTYELSFSDDGTPPEKFTISGAFSVADYRNIVLPAPLHFEDFNGTAEGKLPAGWTEQSFTEIMNDEIDFGNLDSAAYATWTVVDADRFTKSFVTYSNPNGTQAEQEDYRRVLSVNPANIVNGKVLKEPLAQGRFAFGNAGYRRGRSQVLYLFTPDFDLSGKTDVHLAFHSLWEQNQDSMAAVEFSVNQGQTWLPIVYMLDGPDVIKDAAGNVDALETLTREYGDVARYTDPLTGEEKGGSYGAFIGAKIDSTLGPFISARVNDNAVESKRVELFRLPQADNQAKVRFRFAHAGTDSWYFGIDNFGLYSIPATAPVIRISGITRAGNNVVISWAGAPGVKLQKASSLAPASWQDVPGSQGQSSATEPAASSAAFYRLARP